MSGGGESPFVNSLVVPVASFELYMDAKSMLQIPSGPGAGAKKLKSIVMATVFRMGGVRVEMNR